MSERSGILRLENAEDGVDIESNKGRTVTGTLTVPPAAYRGTVNGSLNLRVEIFSKGDSVETYSADGLITASHGEYNEDNNSQVVQIEHSTFFETATKVTLAMGNTMRLPVSIATSTGKAPVIQVEEVPDREGSDTESIRQAVGDPDDILGPIPSVEEIKRETESVKDLRKEIDEVDKIVSDKPN